MVEIEIKTANKKINYCMQCGKKFEEENETMTCSACGTKNEYADFELTVQLCTTCHEMVPLIGKYCTFCGKKLRG